MGSDPGHFPEERISDGCPGASLFRRAKFSKQLLVDFEHGGAMADAAAVLSDYKTVHRRFQIGVMTRCCGGILIDVANELRERGTLDEEECFIDATFVMAKGWRRRDRSDETWESSENHGDCGSRRIAAFGEHACREPARSTLGAAMLRLLHDRGQARKPHRRSRLR